MQQLKFSLPYYTGERWQNWIDKVKETGFKLDEENPDVGDIGSVFVNMEDDVVLACLKVIAKFDKKLMSHEEALRNVADIKEIVLKKIEAINEDIDIMLESMQLSLMGVFASCECYIDGAFEKTKSLDKLVKKAVSAEQENNMGEALAQVAQIGANILAGGKIKEKTLDSVPDGFVAEWLDGIDSISAALVGDKSYRDDEPDEGK
ncbi:MAG: DUF2150 family protein [Candidatus Methanoperedenaceae archaeon]|nr:DUF2150 family protein [Candidatus Methanoperedenaceae archaeon]